MKLKAIPLLLPTLMLLVGCVDAVVDRLAFTNRSDNWRRSI